MNHRESDWGFLHGPKTIWLISLDAATMAQKDAGLQANSVIIDGGIAGKISVGIRKALFEDDQ